MIGIKVNIKAYQAMGNAKRKNGFTLEETLLTHYDTIPKDGKKVAYQYLAGFLKSGSAIFELNVDTKEQKKIIGEGYFGPKYSNDGNWLLVGENQRKPNLKTRIFDIYILNILTGKKIKIAGI